ncbi:virulence protein, partial [Salmonella enterica]|nr:virulence protein [Salmonella enterica]
MLKHLQNSLSSINKSNTVTSQDDKNQINHHRNFQSQIDTTNNILYNNCWVCSLNVIK